MKSAPKFFWLILLFYFNFSLNQVFAVSCGSAANHNTETNPFPLRDSGGKIEWENSSLCKDAAAVTDLGILKNCNGECNVNTIYSSFPEGGSRGWTCWGTYSNDIHNTILENAIPCVSYFSDDTSSCARVNDNRACDGELIQSSSLYDFRYSYIKGKNNGKNEPCQCRQSCLQYGNTIGKNVKPIGGCGKDFVGIKIKKNDSPDGYLHGANKTSGDDEGVCVQCVKISPPWFQITDGNIYAAKNIINNIPENATNKFLIKKSISLHPGIPIVQNGLISITNDKFSERSNIFNISAKNTLGFTKINNQTEDFNYFSHLLNYQALESCYSGFTQVNEGSQNSSFVCKVSKENNSGNYSLLINQDYFIGGKEIYFIEGDLTINGDGVHKIIIDKNTGFLAFIVQGDIIFSEDFGISYDSGNLKSSPTSDDALINGFFLSSGTIKFPAANTANRYDNSFTDKPCSKQIILAGNYIGWGKNDSNQGFDSLRTFAGCMHDENNYIDYNSGYPIINILAAPYMIKNIPSWFKNSNKVVFETI